MGEINPSSNLTALPEEFRSGSTVKYTRTMAHYPADDGWALTLTLVGLSVSGKLTKAGVANAKSFDFTLSDTDTAAVPAGNYRWIEEATKGAVGTFVAGTGYVQVLPDISAAAAGALQTQESKWLATVEAILNGQLTDGLERYTVLGRSADLIPASELLTIRAQLRAIVRRQENPGKLLPEVRVAFTGVEHERAL